MNQEINPSNICTSCGAQEALFTSMATFCDPGDEVVMVTPAFDSYFKSAGVLGLSVKTVTLEKAGSSCEDHANEYYLMWTSSRVQLQKGLKWSYLILLVSPLGKFFSKEELEDIANVILNHENQNIVVLSDEVYEHMTYDGESHCHIASVSPKMFEKTVSIFSVGKTFSCTGKLQFICSALIRLLT